MTDGRPHADPRSNRLLDEVARSSLDEVSATLRGLGLTRYAAEAFCALARLPSATAGDLVARTGIPDSKIYYALDELADRDLVQVRPGKPKLYVLPRAREIEARLRALVRRRHEREEAAVRRLASVLEPLRAAAGSPGPAAEIAFVIKGAANITARAKSMTASARKEVLLMTSNEGMLRSLEPELARAIGRRVQVRLAVPNLDLEHELERKADRRRIVCECTALVVDGEEILTVSRAGREDARGILSTDPTLVAMGREYWESEGCCEECA